MLSLRRPRHKNAAAEVLFSSITTRNEEKKNQWRNEISKRTNGLSLSNLVQILCDMWACLFLERSWNPGRIFVTAALISLSTSIRDRYLVLMTVMAENPASH